jgi:hypothetical protein
VKGQCAFDAVGLQQSFAPRRLFQDFPGQVFAFEQQAQLRFVQRGIVQQR